MALFEAWRAAYTVAHVTSPLEPRSFPGHLLLRAARTHWLLPATAPLTLYTQPAASPAAGILQAVEDTRADQLVMMARPRSFLGQLFHHSVTAQVLRRTRVPVLLLPAEAPTHFNGWLGHN
jgi:nucleotide-binding universal stress UspA family protein